MSESSNDIVNTPSAPSAPRPVAQASPAEAQGSAIDMHLEGDREVADPETLMQEVRQSRMTRAILISLVAHILLVGLTSFGLFADWARYGIMMPYQIKAEKTARAEAEQKLKAKEDADKKEAAAKAEKAAHPEGEQKNNTANTGAEATAKPEAQKEKSNYEKEVMEVSNERPTKSSITGLDGDLDLNK